MHAVVRRSRPTALPTPVARGGAALAHPTLLAALVTLSCAGSLSQGIYTEGDTRFHIGAVPASWQLVHLAGNDVAYLSRDSPHSLAVNATCEDHDDPPLDVLTRHLLMGFTARTTLDERRFRLAGREALRTQATAQLDGVPVELVLVVVKKDGCIYDFTLLAPTGRVAERVTTLDQVLAQFSAGDGP